MMQILKQILAKWACCHDWKEFREITYINKNSALPHSGQDILICKKCGKFKKLNYKKF